MTVHSIHIFDRKGATLFTKTYSRSAKRQGLQLQETTGSIDPDTNPMDEQRKLVFGMLFSLKSSILKNLTPSGKDAGKNEDQFQACTQPFSSFETIWFGSLILQHYGIESKPIESFVSNTTL